MNVANSLELINQLAKENSEMCCSKQDIELLLLHTLDIEKNELYRKNPKVNKVHLKEIKHLIDRRNLGEPVAYMLEKKGFWNLDLTVNQNVLIPRPETELLVEKILSLYDSKPLRLLDLGTGSGAIGLSLLSERPSWEVYCSDLSFHALKVAQENKKNYAINVQLINSDWLSAFKCNSFDIIVSNPPYVDREDSRLLGDGVSYEPLEALVSMEKGLMDLRHIIKYSKKYLKDSGCLLVEHAPEQSEEVIALFKDYSYTSIRLFKDLNGDDRVSFGTIK